MKKKIVVMVFIILGIIIGVFCFKLNQYRMELNAYNALMEYAEQNNYEIRKDVAGGYDLFHIEKECVVLGFNNKEKLEYWFSIDGQNIKLYSIREQKQQEKIHTYFYIDIITNDKLYLNMYCEENGAPYLVTWIECDSTFSEKGLYNDPLLGKNTDSYKQIINSISKNELIKIYNDALTFEKKLNKEVNY